jgi:hypothetical protein
MYDIIKIQNMCEVNSMTQVIKIHPANLKKYYNDLTGNLYYKVPDTSDNWALIEGGWSYSELYIAITEGETKLIFKAGPAESIIKY